MNLLWGVLPLHFFHPPRRRVDLGVIAKISTWVTLRVHLSLGCILRSAAPIPLLGILGVAAGHVYGSGHPPVLTEAMGERARLPHGGHHWWWYCWPDDAAGLFGLFVNDALLRSRCVWQLAAMTSSCVPSLDLRHPSGAAVT